MSIAYKRKIKRIERFQKAVCFKITCDALFVFTVLGAFHIGFMWFLNNASI